MKTSPLAIGEYRGSRGRDLAAPRRPRDGRRRRWLWLLAGPLVAGALGVGAWWAATSPSFAVARVETGRYRYCEQEAVEAALARCLGRSLWTLSAADVADAFAPLPWVRTVHLRRRLPDAALVEIQEWQPLLHLAPAPEGRPRVLVGDGRVLPLPAHLDPPGLPWLEGVELTAEAGHWRLADADAELVLALLDAVAVTGLERIAAVDFVRATPRGLELVLQPDARRLVVGREQFAARLSRYLLGHEQVPAGAVVDLRFADRITFAPPAGS